MKTPLAELDLKIASYRERLLRWSELVAKILTEGADDTQASEAFINAIAAEARQTLSREEVDHYLFNGALHLSWLGLARYHRKRAAAPA